jgi:hypothetical protein
MKSNRTALQEARVTQRTAEAAVTRSAADKDEEIRSLKSRIAALERAAKKQGAARDPNRNAISAKNQPAPEVSPLDTVENGSPEAASIVTA